MRPKRSYLQELASKVNWAVGCRLHTIAPCSLPVQSMEIDKDLNAYNLAVKNLRKSIKARYKDLADGHRHKSKIV